MINTNSENNGYPFGGMWVGREGTQSTLVILVMFCFLGWWVTGWVLTLLF